MTPNEDKLRSLCLATLLVLSVVAGAVALSGSAAGATSASIVSLTNADDDNGNGVPDVDGGTTVQHTLTYTIDDVSADGETDTISVTIPAGSYASLDNLTVTDRATGDEIQVTGAPEVSNDGRTATFDIAPDTDAGSVDIQIEVQFTADWPAVDQNVAGPVNTSVTDSANSDITDSTLATVEIVDTGVVAPDEAAPLNSGGTFYAGQEVAVDGLTAGDEYQVRGVDDGEPDTLRQAVTADDDGSLDFELSDGLADGEFVLVDSDGNVVLVRDGTAQAPQPPTENNTESASFDVIEMDLTAEFDDDSAANDGADATVEYEIESDRRNNYVVNVSAQGDLDVGDLEDIFDEATIVDSFEDDETIQITQNGTTTAEGTYDLDFDDINAGSYTFEANVTDADASDTDAIEVSDAGDPSADFNQSVSTNERGDVVNVSLEMTNSDVATLQVGDVDESGYAVVGQVEDDDEDGVAYVEFNSFAAGSDRPDDTLTGGDDDTSVTDVTNPAESFDGNSPLGSDILDAGDYNMYVVEGEKTGPTVDSSDADASGTLRLTEASVDGLQIWTAPEASLSDLRDADAEDVSAWAGAGNLTRTDTVARDDTVVVQVEASGLEGALELDDATTVYNATSAESELFNLSFEADSGALNQDDTGVNVADLGTANYDVVYDGANDAHYVVLDSAALTQAFDYEDGDAYTANFTVFEDETDLVDDDVSVTQEFSIEDPELELETNETDEIVLGAAAGQEITGTTNLAPGTEVEVTLDSDTSTDPFIERPEATVEANGSFTAVADLSDNDVGSEFTAQAVVDDVESDEYDGRLVEPTDVPETPADGTPETTPGTATETTPETTPGDGTGETPAGPDTPTETPTAGGGPGFTAAVALIALVAAALLAARRHD